MVAKESCQDTKRNPYLACPVKMKPQQRGTPTTVGRQQHARPLRDLPAEATILAKAAQSPWLAASLFDIS